MGIIASPMLADQEWQNADEQASGFRPGLGERLREHVAEGAYPGLHGLLIIRNGALVLERYFDGEDEHWGKQLGVVPHSSGERHDLRSVSKSVVGLLYGIARSENAVPATRELVIDQFPEYSEYVDPGIRRITIGHALTMRLGLAWNEGLDYDSPANSENAMENAVDRCRYVLEQKPVQKPGVSWTYCGGATALLARMIVKGTGMPLDAYAASRLFGPLGITDVEWIKGRDGESVASSGLRLRARDAAKIGQLVLGHGRWRGKAVVPPGWLTVSMKPRAFVDQAMRYGYHWWIGRLASNGKPWWGAFGNGGQRLIIVPSLSMVVVVLAGNYNRADQWKMPVRLMSRLIMPSIEVKR